MVNKVEITITAKNNTRAGFAAARAEAARGGQDVADAYDKSVVTGTRGTGTKVGKQVSDDVVKSTSGTGRRVAKDIDDEVTKGTKDTGKKVSKQIGADLDGLHAQALKLNNVFGTATDKNLLSDADMKSMTARFKGIEVAAAASGKRSGDAFGDNMARNTMGALAAGPGSLLSVAPPALLIAGAGLGVALGGAIAGGIGTALIGGGVVGLAGFFLKDNEVVSKAWGKTWKDIGDDVKRRAGFMENEFAEGAERTAQAWSDNLGPALERIFISAQPLVDDFIDMPTNWLSALAPGMEKAVANAGPAVEGLGLMGDRIFKGIGDGLGDMSTNAEDFKVVLGTVGTVIGDMSRSALGSLGDMAKWFVDNKASVEEWGKATKAAFSEIVEEGGKVADSMAAASSPTGKNAKGQDWWEAATGRPAGSPALPITQAGRDVANAVERTGTNLRDMVTGTNQPVSSTRPVQGSNLDSELRLLSTRKEMNEQLGKLNYLNSIDLNQSQAAIDANLALSQSQAQLLANGAQMTTVTGNNTAANEFYTGAIRRMTEAGVPASDALLNMVSGMNSTELAAMGASVRTDELGRSVYSIPGQKDVIINAPTGPAQNAIYAVQNAVNSLTGKTVYINVITNGMAAAANAVANAANNARAALGYNKGGRIPGGGPNVDSKFVAVTPGEFVVNRKATSANLPMLEAMNEGSGGSAVMDEYARTGSGGGSSSGTPSSGGGGGGGGLVISFDPAGIDNRGFLSAVIGALRFNGVKVPGLTSPAVS